MLKRGFISHNERRYILAHVAMRLCSKYFEIDELINEAWLVEGVRTTQQRWKVFVAGRWAMLTYINKERKRWKRRIHLGALDKNEYKLVEPEIIPRYEIDFLDEIARLEKVLDRKKRLILRCKLEGLTDRAIAKILGYGWTHQNVNQHWHRICSILRFQYQLVYFDSR